ncbi:MAG: PEP-CTERM sorting domain-containing protein [Rubripirellula sp.]
MKWFQQLGYFTTFLLASSNLASAGFVLSIAPSELSFSGPGVHSVDLTITHDGTGPSSLSGYTFQFSAPDAAGAASGADSDVISGAFEGLPIGSGAGAFNFNPTFNLVAASDFTTFTGADLAMGGTATLFTLQTVLGMQDSYAIGVDFQSIQRGFPTVLNEVSFGEGFVPTVGPIDGVGFDTSFTLNVSAVPEPSSIGLLALGTTWCVCRRRRKAVTKCNSANKKATT